MYIRGPPALCIVCGTSGQGRLRLPWPDMPPAPIRRLSQITAETSQRGWRSASRSARSGQWDACSCFGSCSTTSSSDVKFRYEPDIAARCCLLHPFLFLLLSGWKRYIHIRGRPAPCLKKHNSNSSVSTSCSPEATRERSSISCRL